MTTARLQGPPGLLPESVAIGWRPSIAGYVNALPGLRWTELVAESLDPAGPPPAALDPLLRTGTAVVPHGIRLSLGGAAPVEPARVAHLAGCAELLGSPLVSEHLAFVRADVGGAVVEAGHLLPVPRTREALDVLCRNVSATQAELGVPLALEPIASLVDLGGEYDEPDFVTEVLDRTGALLLLDVANVYANARNHGYDPVRWLERVPVERIAYCHVAGGSERDGLYHDTHRHPTPDPVLELVGVLCELHRARTGRAPALLLERDGDYPPAATLSAELDAIAAAAGLPSPTGAMITVCGGDDPIGRG